ncbi:MAG: TetR/AcrR family transcriptional regulator [Deltaproteobacteria bacterium]|nr:TetR/AcrR family transcriptional regulator [Deltaproteobacteria bacterium]
MTATPASPPRERARSARRQALLETAEQVFAERGFEGATMAEIGTRAGYSAGNLYNVFESKEALFREVITASSRALNEALGATLAASAPLGETLDRFVDVMVRFVIEHRAFFALYVRVTEGRDWTAGQLGDEWRRLRDEHNATIVARLRRAMTGREIPKEDPEACADLVGGTLYRHLVRWIDLGGREEDLVRSLPGVRRLLHRALGVKR